MIARKLESKIRDHLHGSSTARSSGGPGLFAQSEGSGLGGLSRPGAYIVSDVPDELSNFLRSVDFVGPEFGLGTHVGSFVDVPSASA